MVFLDDRNKNGILACARHDVARLFDMKQGVSWLEEPLLNFVLRFRGDAAGRAGRVAESARHLSRLSPSSPRPRVQY